jgi:carboxypeptidase Taq
MSAYQELERRFHRLRALRDATGVLHWDMSTMMPSGGAAARAEQLASLQVVCHGILVDPALADLMDEAGAEVEVLDPWQAANLREMRHQWIHATAVDAKLVEALSKAVSLCETIWRKARPAADFAMVRPALAEVLALVREAGQAKAARLGCSTYEALLDEYEPGGRTAEIDRIFDDLAVFLPDFREAVLARQRTLPDSIEPAGPFPVAAQRALAERLMTQLGFDFDHGRLDTSLHPFCGGVPDDVRITTRYDESDFASALMGVLHETGHALYERGLPVDWRFQPVGQARGMSVHESQSLLIEMQACRSRAFIEYLAPLLRETFATGSPARAWDAENLYRLYTRVKPGYIRVDADEVTYPAHVILRYRLEKDMIAGALDLADLPAGWNAGMQDLLGITPPTDREGCLQDIHWFDGAWGYFPTYTLGAMTAAQLFDAARRAHPEIPESIARGDFTPLLGWLREKVHSKGSLLSTDDLLRQATGRPLDPAIFKHHLRSRYLD